MSFTCRDHGWSHIYKSCPACQPAIISGSNATLLGPMTIPTKQLNPSNYNLEIDKLKSENERLMKVISVITSLPCDSDKYPDCRVCRSIDVVAHADMGRNLEEFETNELKQLRAALEVAKNYLSVIGAYFDCMHCENHSGYVCEDHLDNRMSEAKKAITKINEIMGENNA